MKSKEEAQRHLWLTLSDVPDRGVHLDEPVSAGGLFGQSFDVIQAKFKLRKKQTEALCSIIPRWDAKPKPQFVLISLQCHCFPPRRYEFELPANEAATAWSDSMPLDSEQGPSAGPPK